MISNRTVITTDKLPCECLGVLDGEFAETKVCRIQKCGEIGETLSRAEFAVALNVTSHAVDQMGHGMALVGVVGIVVDDRGAVNGTVGTKWDKAFVPVDMAGKSIRKSTPRLHGLSVRTRVAYPDKYTSVLYLSNRLSNAVRTSFWYEE